jgi:excisionase family DNA binding protein
MSVVMDDRFMTLKEVAQYLHLNERTVYKWAQEGTIPGSKLGSTWRFRRSEIDSWVEQHKNARFSSNKDKG